MKTLKRILAALALLFIAGQFVRPAKNIAARPSPDDIALHHETPPAVGALLAAACYDCHSDTTRYPWYANIQPVGWWLASHVEDGKKHLNFSAFASYTPKRAARKMEEIADTVNEREMPLRSYTVTHADARLSGDQIKLLAGWAETVRASILAKHGLSDE